MSELVLDVSNLTVKFPPQGNNDKPAVDNVSFQLKKGEILGIVGESGSGKSVTSLAIMGLIQKPGKIVQGSSIKYYQLQKDRKKDRSILEIPLNESTDWQKYRGREIAMIFQEPMSAFNPVYTIGYQLVEMIQEHQEVTQEQAKNQAIDLLQQVKVLGSDEELKQEYFKSLLLEKLKEKYLAENKHKKNDNKLLKERDDEYEELKSKYLEELKEKKSEELKDKYLLENKDKKNNSKTLDTKSQNYVKQQKKACFKKYPHEFSGGQLQRVMIAMAISCKPKILIADEPTTALDVTVQKGILKLLKDLCKDDNIAMIFISHDLGVINEVADNILVMRCGSVIEKGTKEQIIYHPQDPYTKGLLACRPPLHKKVDKLPTVDDFSKKEKSLKLSNNSALDNEIDSHNEVEITTQKANKDNCLLIVQNLTVEFGKFGIFGSKNSRFIAVDKVNFYVKEGETLGLVGESGCGKSTLARTILQLISASKGAIYFKADGLTLPSEYEGYDLSKIALSEIKIDAPDLSKFELSKINQKSLRKKRKDMQIVFQNPYSSLNPRLTVGEAITEPMIIHQTEKSSKKRREKAEDLLQEVGLKRDDFDCYPHEFSGGQRQRICIARALILEPRLLICDESVSALDVSVQAEVLNLFKRLQKKRNFSCIFISHDLSVVRFMSDRIMVMKKGKIVEIGEAENVINNPQQDYTKNLLNSIPKFPEDLKWELEDTVNSNPSI